MGSEVKHLRDLHQDPRNVRLHNPRNVGMIVDALREVGAARSGVIDEEGRILAGNATWEALAEAGIERVKVVQADGEEWVVVQRSGLTEEQKRRLALYDNRTGELADWDIEMLAGDIELLDGLWSANELELMLDRVPSEPDDDLPGLMAWDVPDALFPSDNVWDVPSLRAELQAQQVDLPVSLWGALGRKKRMKGTWLFYCEDYRFEALWKDPSDVVNTQCVNVVEPNFTVGPQTPRAVALWQIYRKRWLARWWQSHGIRVFVDMNVDAEVYGDLMLLGVPEGWKAYATRGYSDRQQFTLMEYELAREHAGGEPLFMLYGGGEACEALARDHGWVWISEHMDQKRGGVVSG